jgi:outer membrane murein-binding lipoprotein Lpp
MRRTLCLLVAAALLLLAGCATNQRTDLLSNTLNAYGSALRWGDFQSAAQFIDPKQRAEHPISKLDQSRYEQVKVSEYDAGNGPVPAGEGQVQQIVHIGLINVHTQSERSIVDHQTWHYDDKTKHWWLTSGLPDITQQ